MPKSLNTRISENKPKCDSHPKATVLKGRLPGDTKYQWICMDCGKKLGFAGIIDLRRERFLLGD